MMDIGPGDFVECVAVGRSDWLRGGALYCVEATPEAWGGCPQCGGMPNKGLFFKGQPVEYAMGVLMSYCPCRFRPIYRPSTDLIQSLLTDIPSEEKVLAPTPETYGEG